MWGVFDILHEGHSELLKKASSLGHLRVIIMPDRIVKESKRIVYDENIRRENLIKTGFIKDVYIEALPHLKCFDLASPDIFCFGYDQKGERNDKVKSYIKNKFPTCQFMAMDKHGDIHSSDLRETIMCPCGSDKIWKNCCGK